MIKDSNQRHRPARRPGSRRPEKTGRLAAEFPHQYRSAVSPTGPSEQSNHPSESKPLAPRTTAERVKLYLSLVLICNSFGLIAVLAVGLFLVVGGFTDLQTLATSLSVGWSVLNLIPLHASGVTFGFLPLLPALCFCAVMAWRYRQAIKHRVSVKDLQVLLILVPLVPLIISVVAQVIIGTEVSPEELTWSKWWEVILRVLLLHWFALGLAIPMKIWRALLKKAGLDLRISTAFLRAWRFLCYLALAGLVLVIVMLMARFSEFKEALVTYTGATDYMGITALVIIVLAYLPNAVIGVAGVVLGSIFHIGETSLSLMAMTYGPLPVFPLLAVLPEQETTWMPVLFSVPVAAAIVVYIQKTPQLLETVETGLAGIVLTLILSVSASGTLGVYGVSGPSLVVTPLLTGAWMLVSGFIVWLVGRWAISRGKLIEIEIPALQSKTKKTSSSVTSKPVGGIKEKQTASSQGAARFAQDVQDTPAPNAQNAPAQEDDNHHGQGLPIKRPQNSQATLQIKSKDNNTSDNEVTISADENGQA